VAGSSIVKELGLALRTKSSAFCPSGLFWQGSGLQDLGVVMLAIWAVHLCKFSGTGTASAQMDRQTISKSMLGAGETRRASRLPCS
jgi:hypothetical protein